MSNANHESRDRYSLGSTLSVVEMNMNWLQREIFLGSTPFPHNHSCYIFNLKKRRQFLLKHRMFQTRVLCSNTIPYFLFRVALLQHFTQSDYFTPVVTGICMLAIRRQIPEWSIFKHFLGKQKRNTKSEQQSMIGSDFFQFRVKQERAEASPPNWSVVHKARGQRITDNKMIFTICSAPYLVSQLALNE